MIRSAAVVVLVAACGGKTPAPQTPKVDVPALATELDGLQAELATVFHRDLADCTTLATNLRALFAKMTAAFARAHDAQKDPAIAKALTAELKRYDGAAAQRTAAIEADLKADPRCVSDPSVRDVLMTMPTL